MPDIRSARHEMNFFQRLGYRISRFFQETIGELRKVSWPSRQEAFRLTQIVLIVIGIMSIILGGLDWIFAQLFGLILGS